MPLDSHWQHWHEQYAEAESPLNHRLSIVRSHIAHWLDEPTDGAGGRRRVVSACAGDGRDVLAVLADRRPDDVETVLIELDPGLAQAARQFVDDAQLPRVEVRNLDAGVAACYRGAVPADLLLLCGIFGNVSDDDVRHTIRAVPQLAAPGGTVIWTRSRRSPDLTPSIHRWFAGAGCEEVAFNAPAGELFSVGVHRFPGPSQPLEPDDRWFRFVTAATSSPRQLPS